jgi:hypothetical protein
MEFIGKKVDQLKEISRSIFSKNREIPNTPKGIL